MTRDFTTVAEYDDLTLGYDHGKGVALLIATHDQLGEVTWYFTDVIENGAHFDLRKSRHGYRRGGHTHTVGRIERVALGPVEDALARIADGEALRAVCLPEVYGDA